jgi:glycosyltransferase involved in cell wall biosynthesis
MNISFIIPCFNCEATLAESIHSIFDGNFSEGDEIILVDDSSTDATPDVICQLKKKYNDIISIKHNINKGCAAASRNSAIDISKNKLLFCLDADNILMQNTISVLKKFLIENNLDAAAFGEIRYFKEKHNNISATWYLNRELNFIDALNYPKKTPCGSGNYLFTKNIWKKADRFNESLGGALDSELFGLCILAVGAKFKTLEGYGYFHRHGYQSTFIKEINKHNASLTILAGIIRYIDLIDSNSIDYMFGSVRTNWWYNTSKRPIKAASKEQKLKMKMKRRIFGLLERI